ncbi:hypothetical protein LEMLEM_LOCUS6418, partial [Lemmus lemmus]
RKSLSERVTGKIPASWTGGKVRSAIFPWRTSPRKSWVSGKTLGKLQSEGQKLRTPFTSVIKHESPICSTVTGTERHPIHAVT